MLNKLNHPEQTFFSSSSLKIIAMISMVIDHIGAFILLPWLNNTLGIENRAVWIDLYNLSRALGRLAFPLFCFLLVEGFYHTSNVNKYMARLAVFALVSEIPFDLARSHMLVDWSGQNVFFTLLAGLIAIWALRDIDKIWLRLIIVALAFLAVIVLNTDYSYQGVALIMILYVMREYRLFQSLLGAWTFLASPYAMISFILTYFYNGQKGRYNSHLLYWIYPVHLLIYAAIGYYLIS